MTESDWKTCTDPIVLLTWLREQGLLSDRKARLFAVAVCRRIWPLLTDERSRRAVEVAEQYADGHLPQEEMLRHWNPAFEAANEAHLAAMNAEMYRPHAGWDRECAAKAAAEALAGNPQEAATAAGEAVANLDRQDGPESEREAYSAWDEEQRRQCQLLADIVGPLPFRTVVPNPAWQTPHVVAIATSIYETKDFGRMAAVAAALQDAGCEDAVLLEHLSGPGPFVKGDWALDLVLGKQ